MLQLCLRVQLKEDLVGGHVEGGDDLLGISDQLGVEVSVVAEQVLTVHIQERVLQGVDLE